MVENADNGNLVGELVFVKWRGTDEFAGLTWRQGIGSSVEIRERQGWRSVSELWGSEARGILAPAQAGPANTMTNAQSRIGFRAKYRN